MKELSSGYGRVFIGSKVDCFRTAVFLAEGQPGRNPTAKTFTWGAARRSTPWAWFQGCGAKAALSPGMLATTHWFASDERYVRIDSHDSNFGTAQRLLLNPLNVVPAKRHPWPIAMPPGLAAVEFGRINAPYFVGGKCFDICFLGMGEDGHTASLFPESPLLSADGAVFFAAVDVPGKDWRLTITPSGIHACGLVVVMVLGEAKAATLHRVLAGPHDPRHAPVQIVKESARNVVWLIDEGAAAKFLT